MKKSNHGKWITSVATFILTLICFIDFGTSAELRPFKIPEQKIQSGSPENNRQIEESVYTRFERRVETLDEEEKNKWTQQFEDKRDHAVVEEKWDQVKHYAKLLEILNKTKE